MSKTIDEKVVSMKMDSADFEKNAEKSIGILNKLKQSLSNFDSKKYIEGIGDEAKRVDFSPLANGVDTVKAKFSALQIAGMTAIANITNSAINAGKNIVSALTIDPIKTGFQEYETQMNAVQTILANTKSKGSTLNDVNKALDELNTYADKTIYNFTEMTRNIGTFTAAGVDLDKSVTSIKGIANLAAVSGSSSQQASTAMYQLSQALAAGKVQLMDWNSVVNAGMGGEVFQTALKRTAKQMGKDVDGLIEKYGSFRESLTNGEWLTSDVLTETLTQLSGAYTEADLLQKGYTKEQAKDILDLADTAVKAATKVKTVTQLWDTLKEAAQSGWTQSWQIIIGDFEEAKELLSGISDTVSDWLNKQSEARNKLLQGWKDLGGRTALLESFKNIISGIGSVIKPISEAFRDIFPPMTAKRLFELTDKFREFTSKLKLSDDNAKKLKETFKGLFSIVSIIGQGLGAVFKPIFSWFTGSAGGSILSSILDITSAIGKFFTKLNESIKAGNGFKMVSDTISNGLNGISNIFAKIKDKFKGGEGLFDGISDAASKFGSVISRVFNKLKEGGKDAFKWIKENIGIGDIFAGLAGAGVFTAARKFGKMLDAIKKPFETIVEMFKGGDDGGVTKFRDVLGSVKDSLESFQQGIKVASIVMIAGAIAILVHSIKTLSQIEPDKIAISLGAMAALMKILTAGFKSMTKSLSSFKSKGVIKSAVAMMAMAKAIDILASAMNKVKDLSWEQIAKGLASIGGAMFALTKAMKGINGNKVSLRSSVAMLAMAKTAQMLGTTMKDLSTMSWKQIGKGLSAMGGALLEMSLVMRIMGKISGGKSLAGALSILIVSKSLGDIADGLKKFGDMDWGEIGRGLAGMGGALAAIGTVNAAVGKIAGMSSVFAAGSIYIVTKGLDEISDNLIKIGNMDWEGIKKGLAGMGGALLEIGAINAAVGKIAGMSSLFAAGSIRIVTDGLDEISENLINIGNMEWGSIKRGLTGMGGALAEIAIATGALGKIAGLSSLFAAGSIYIVTRGLDEISDSLQKIGAMTWSSIKRGLTGMGGALAEIALMSGALGSIAPVSSLLGGGAILLTVQGLGDIADALQKFGDMSWDEIARGLVAMGGALGETGLAAALTGLSGISGLLGGGSILLTVQGLGDLATALQKFGEMNWDEIGRGLSAMAGALGETALGGLLNSLSGLGAISIGLIAEPLGTLAESMKKWKDVEVPLGLGPSLIPLAAGITAFTTSIIGSVSVALVAEPLGILVDSIKKLNKIEIPEDMASKLQPLADAIKSFTTGIVGAITIDKVGEPLGVLADSIKKLNEVKITGQLTEGLKSLAGGIKEFKGLFTTGFTISNLTGPLSDLASSLMDWNGVSVPQSLGKGLASLAEGVKAFGGDIWQGWSLGSVVGPIGKLAEATSKWNGVTLPAGIGVSLMSMADGVKAFEGITLDNFASGTITTALVNIRTTVDTLTNLTNFNPETLNNLVTGINSIGQMSLNGLTESINNGVAQIGPAIQTMMSTIINTLQTAIPSVVPPSKAIGTAIAANIKVGLDEAQGDIQTSVSGITAKITESINSKVTDFGIAGVSISTAIATGMKTGLDPLPTIVSDVVQKAVSVVSGTNADFGPIGLKMAKSLANGIGTGGGAVRGKIDGIMNACVQAAESKLSSFSKTGSTMMGKLSSGITSKASVVKSAVKGIVDGAVSVAKNCYSDFSSAGRYAAQGFADGIASKAQAAAQEAAKMVTNAINAAKKAADINSPSRKFRALGEFSGEGYVIGIDSYQDKAYQSGKDMANASMNGLRKSIDNISDYVSDNIDARPVISPVLDLSQLSKQSKGVGRILNLNPSLSASSLSRTTRFGRSYANPNSDIVSALKDLKQSVANNAGNTYVIDGITYDDGSNVSSAVQSLIRAAKIERRV